LIDGEDGRKPLGTFGAVEPFQPLERKLEHISVKEDQRTQSLRLRTRREIVRRQAIEEAFEVCPTERGGMPLAAEEDVSPRPVRVGLNRALTVVPASADPLDLIEQLDGFRGQHGSEPLCDRSDVLASVFRLRVSGKYGSV